MENESAADFLAYRRSGDIAALGRVFDREAPGLHRVARRLVPRIAGEVASPDDLVQATFLTAIEKAASFQEGRPIGAWLVGILGLHARNAARREGRRAAQDTGVELAEADEPSPERRAHLGEWQEAVRSTLARLPERYRPVLEAVLIEECEPAEAARRLALQPATARQRLHRGLERLRDALPRGFAELSFGTLASLSFGRRAQAMRQHILESAAQQANVSPMALGGSASLPLGASGFAAVVLTMVGLGTAWSLWGVGGSRGDAVVGQPELTAASFGGANENEEREATAPGSVRRQVAEPGDEDAPTGAPQRNLAATRFVSGRVHVLNTARPIEGAEVVLRTQPTQRVVAHTDAQGRFRFPIDELPSDGLPNLQVAAPGFADYVVPRGEERRRSFAKTESVHERGDEITFLIQMYPSYDVTGRVLDPEGHPVAGAELFVLDGLGQLLREHPVAVSEYDGHFRLEGVAEFFYKQPRPLPLIAISEHGVGFVRVGEEELADHTLGVGVSPPPIEGVELRIAESLTTSVLVLDEDDRPLAGARVQARPQAMEWNSYRAPSEAGPLWIDELPERFAAHFESTSDARGIAHFAALPVVQSRHFGSVAVGEGAERRSWPLSSWVFHAETEPEKAQASGKASLLPRGLLEFMGEEEGPALVLRPVAVAR